MTEVFFFSFFSVYFLCAELATYRSRKGRTFYNEETVFGLVLHQERIGVENRQNYITESSEQSF